MRPTLIEKWYRAEILSIGEFREYRAESVDAAAELAAEEFGEDDIGRVTEKR
ncbi:hypothetical protein [Pseudomonas tolaasii]|uniref:hypothetical protein n=1 Tax=Pseudomonas tolaasii TaxID=29442 RepID=UPI0018C89ACA|nr:hypothetical protein [Pseudomonas tolaasii]